MRIDSRDLLSGLGAPPTCFQRKRLTLPVPFSSVCKMYVQPGAREIPELFFTLWVRAVMSRWTATCGSLVHTSPLALLSWSRTLNLPGRGRGVKKQGPRVRKKLRWSVPGT